MNGPLLANALMSPATSQTVTAGATASPAFSTVTRPLAFAPVSHVRPLPGTPAGLPRTSTLPLNPEMTAPPKLNANINLKDKLAKAPQRAENLLNALIENPEYGDLAKTVLTSVASSIEIGKFVHAALKEFNLAATLTGNGVMAAVIGSAVVVGGSQIAQKIPGSRAALNAKVEHCIKQITEELEVRERIREKLGQAADETTLTPGTPEFDAAVEVCVQELKSVPNTNNLTVGKLREFVQDLFAHLRALIDLFRGNNANNAPSP